MGRRKARRKTPWRDSGYEDRPTASTAEAVANAAKAAEASHLDDGNVKDTSVAEREETEDERLDREIAEMEAAKAVREEEEEREYMEKKRRGKEEADAVSRLQASLQDKSLSRLEAEAETREIHIEQARKRRREANIDHDEGSIAIDELDGLFPSLVAKGKPSGGRLLSSLNEDSARDGVTSADASTRRTLEPSLRDSSYATRTIRSTNPTSVDVGELEGYPHYGDKNETYQTALMSENVGKEDAVLDDVMEQLDDRMTIMSGSVDDTEKLGPEIKYQLAVHFVHELLKHAPELATSGNKQTSSVESTAARALRAYSLMLRDSADNEAHRSAYRFVRQHRNLISSILRNRPGLGDDEEDECRPSHLTPLLSLEGRIFDWLDGVVLPAKFAGDILASTAAPSRVLPAIGSDTHGSVQADPGDPEDEAHHLLPNFELMQHFLTGDPSWRWLVGRLQADASRLHWPDGILDAIIQTTTLPTTVPTDGTGRHCVEFTIEWNPRLYLQRHFEQTNDFLLENTITLSGQADQLEATSCAEYLQRNWELVGTKLLSTLQSALADGLGEVETEAKYDFPEQFTVSFRQDGDLLVVWVSARLPILVEVGEQLAWLGAACAESIYCDAPCYRKTVLCERTRGYNIHRLHIDYETSKVDGVANCWHPLLRNPSIAYDFPARQREQGISGIEMSADMMITLGKIVWATADANKFMLKGFASMLYPVTTAAQSIVWHFVCNEDGSHLPYAAARDSCWDNEALAGSAVPWLHTSRHFVGWTAAAASAFGTKEYNYARIGYPNNLTVGSNLRLEKVTFTAGLYLTAGAHIAQGSHHRGIFYSHDVPIYRSMVYQARAMYALFYDTAAQRAYLTDGASALLHLTFTQLRTPARQAFTDNNLEEVLVYANRHERDGAVTALRNEHNLNILLDEEETEDTAGKVGQKHFRVKQLIQNNYLVLSKLWERHMNELEGKDLRFTNRDRLEGWSYMDVVHGERMLEPKQTHLQQSGKGWTEFAKKLKAVALFGTGFGELIAPTTPICQSWTVMPSGYDYMACTMSLLRNVADTKGYRDGFPMELMNGMSWHRGSQLFDPCPSFGGSCCCDRVQTLLPSGILSKAVGFRYVPTAEECDVHGAVIFGHSSRFDVEWPADWRYTARKWFKPKRYNDRRAALVSNMGTPPKAMVSSSRVRQPGPPPLDAVSEKQIPIAGPNGTSPSEASNARPARIRHNDQTPSLTLTKITSMSTQTPSDASSAGPVSSTPPTTLQSTITASSSASRSDQRGTSSGSECMSQERRPTAATKCGGYDAMDAWRRVHPEKASKLLGPIDRTPASQTEALQSDVPTSKASIRSLRRTKKVESLLAAMPTSPNSAVAPLSYAQVSAHAGRSSRTNRPTEALPLI